MIESQNIIQRVLLLKKNLENLQSVLEVVAKNFKLVDDSLIRMQTQTKARLSIEYIKSNYITPFMKDPIFSSGMSSGPIN